MDDRALLEAAARAAGIDAWWSERHITLFLADKYDSVTEYKGDAVWNPLHNDADAFRLCVKLGIAPRRINASVFAWIDGVCDIQEPCGDDPYAAARRAIVRAAAALQETSHG